MYVLTMAPPTATTDRRAPGRLDREDWLNQAWGAFVSGGIGAVSIQALAEQLGVSRGSFYHHFADRQDLEQEMLRYWEERWTLAVRENVRSLGLDPANTLMALMNTIRHWRASAYDVMVRAWAIQDSSVQDAVRRVDEERLAFIRSQFVALGFDELEAENRARLFLYYEMAEPAVMVEQSPELEAKLVLARHSLLTGDTPSNTLEE